MGAEHTAGPWAVSHDPADARQAPIAGGVAKAPFGICVGQSGTSIADLWFGTDCGQHISRDEAAANAALIAAAPDLLEAAREAKEILDLLCRSICQPEAGSTADKLTRAIARAEGR